jgi:hypothetical protein
MQVKRIRGPRWQAPHDELVLAAIDRAERHSVAVVPGVLLADMAGRAGRRTAAPADPDAREEEVTAPSLLDCHTGLCQSAAPLMRFLCRALDVAY